ncbi:acetyl-CoA carboxylase biotin carboxylase subunit [bacterium]|nr:acetyl-CoA carboxylase biotin carboxylase subunit [bacterium]
MFSKILVANRGEIALRVMRAARELGIETVAVYSEADADSLHVRFADHAVCIGPPMPSKSYLNSKALITAAEITGADSIHPGYGFLAENAEFAEACEVSGLTFIGPSPDAISRMGDKSLAKSTMRAANVPVTPGSDGALSDLAQARKVAAEIGYPVILKASAGGGGKGMRIARTPETLETSYELARSEAEASFSNPELYLEKFITNPRHIEIQLMGDQAGNVIHLGERDCSIQRRHQKLIEESPSPAVTPELRASLGDAAVLGAKSVNYVGAGTMEFLLDEDGSYYFMEMNTRIQVEHPVTEMVTGIDLVKLQIQVAAGMTIPFTQDEITFNGHAIEFRINAEDPDRNFLPAPGTLETFHIPGGFGVRVDSHCYSGYFIPPYYDSLLAKLIVHGKDREEAILRAHRALEEFFVVGVPTTIPFHLQVLETEAFQTGNVSTVFLENWLAGKGGK